MATPANPSSARFLLAVQTLGLYDPRVEFVCPDPNALVRAANVRATLDAFELVPITGRAIVERHNLRLEELGPDKYVLVQNWLDALREIQSSVGPNLVRKVGAGIIRNADFPSELDQVETILFELDNIYHANHIGEIGHYVTRRHPSGAIVVECRTPYPRAFEHGLIEGICQRHENAAVRYRIGYEDGPPNSELTCTLTVIAEKR